MQRIAISSTFSLLSLLSLSGALALPAEPGWQGKPLERRQFQGTMEQYQQQYCTPAYQQHYQQHYQDNCQGNPAAVSKRDYTPEQYQQLFCTPAYQQHYPQHYQKNCQGGPAAANPRPAADPKPAADKPAADKPAADPQPADPQSAPLERRQFQGTMKEYQQQYCTPAYQQHYPQHYQQNCQGGPAAANPRPAADPEPTEPQSARAPTA
ncbi:hypothetical protein TWF694_010801 [Orbilia ellipsospora]|uniref:Uncharacterized protein n=1 Tax=Orbilia ellipsospora TaxID=2528407 RepID=A0AAV9X732_9PEZI